PGRNFYCQRGTQPRGGECMKTNVIPQLILKDWRLQSRTITLLTLAGVAALAFLPIGGKAIVVGTVFFFVAMIFCACLLPVQNIVNEQKKQTLPFIMSLPLSSAQYGAAKLISTTGMFLISWLALLGVALFMTLVRHTVPNGGFPIDRILPGQRRCACGRLGGVGHDCIGHHQFFLLARMVHARQPCTLTDA